MREIKGQHYCILFLNPMITRKHTVILILFLYISLISTPVFADNPNFSKTYPLPITEMENVILTWLKDSDFEILRKDLEFGQLRLSAKIQEEVWEIDLSPQYPFNTTITIFKKSGVEFNQNRPNHLWNYISKHLNSPDIEIQDIEMPDTKQSVPTHVVESVVCIEAEIEGVPCGTSGFIVHKNGLIVSTAHDLENTKSVNVILYDKRELTGKILKKDFHRDLVLIKVAEKFGSSISLPTGRNLLKKGEKLYSVSCPLNLKEPVFPGIFVEPRRVDDLILLECNMKIYLGNSGSPVFDAHGNLVGIVKGRFRETVSVGFLIPVETLLEFIQDKQLP